MKVRIHMSAVLAALIGGASGATAADLNMASGLATTHSVEKLGGAALMACIQEKSAGDIKISYFPNGQIVSTSNAVEGLEQGLADIAFVAPVGQSGRMPLTGLALIPGMGTGAEQMAVAFRKVVDGDNPIAAEWKGLGIRPLAIISSPAYQILSTRPPIDSIDDFKGMKLRAAGSSMLGAVSAVGAVAVEVVGPESYVAMQRGVIDATIAAAPSSKSYALQELGKSMTTNANFGTPVYAYSIREAKWAELSDAQKAVLTECGAQIEASANQALDQENLAVYSEFAAAGVETYDLGPELLAEIDTRLAGVAQEFIGRLKGAGVQGAQESYEALRAALGK